MAKLHWKGGVIFDYAYLPGSPPPKHVARRRTLYLPVYRSPPAWAQGQILFDAPLPTVLTGARAVTAVPTQSLYLINSSFLIEQSKMAAARLLADDKATDEDRIATFYLRALSRPPREVEVQRMLDTMSRLIAGGTDRVAAWGLICHAVFASNEFLMRLYRQP